MGTMGGKKVMGCQSKRCRFSWVTPVAAPNFMCKRGKKKNLNFPGLRRLKWSRTNNHHPMGSHMPPGKRHISALSRSSPFPNVSLSTPPA